MAVGMFKYMYVFSGKLYVTQSFAMHMIDFAHQQPVQIMLNSEENGFMV